MRHTLIAEGYGIRIRPVRMEDAAFIVWLRNLDHAKGKLGDSATSVAAQEDWLRTYFDRDGDYYFIVETTARLPVGTNSIYDLVDGEAECGRLIILPGIMAALPASIITYDLAFTQMKLKQLRATSVGTNHSLHSFVRKMGARQVGVEPGARIINGTPVDLLHFHLTADAWAQKRSELIPLAEYASHRIAEWNNRPHHPPPTIN